MEALVDSLLDRPRFSYLSLLALEDVLAEPGSVGAAGIIKAVDESDLPLESDDDPHRLARVNLERYASSRNGATLRFWRDEWYVWKRDRYRRIPTGELKAKITGSIRREFESLWQQAMADYEADASGSDDDGPPRIRKVTRNLLTDVINATAGMVIISSGIDQMTWIGSDGTREHRNYVSLKNGILDMDAVLSDSDDVLLPHTPEWFSTISLPYDFDPEAKCPRWEAFLNKMMDGDETFIKLLQEWAGYMLLPDTGEQKFLANEGEGGNGKSVFCAAISAMVGTENCSFVPLEEFGDRFSKSSTIGKLVNICADVGELDRVAEGYLKSFTSGDAMYFDRKGIAPLQCVPTARMIVNWNNRPKLADRSGGIWRRIVLVPWDVEVAESDKIKNMDKAAWWERSGELPGMLNWALVGLGRLRQQGGFTPSDRSKGLVDDYRTDANPTRRFLLECIELSHESGPRSPEIGLYCDQLYRFYVWWMKENGHKCFPKEIFGKEIRKVFKKIERTHDFQTLGNPWFYRGIIFQSEKILGESTKDCTCYRSLGHASGGF